MSAVTATPKSIRPHVQIAELEDSQYGYRYWTTPFKSSLEFNLFLSQEAARGHHLSDISCANECWCVTELA